VVVVQHMPERFTQTFAQRLDRLSSLHVQEADGSHPLVAGAAWVCPGGRCIEVAKQGRDLVARVASPREHERYVPSADRLFESAAEVAGERVVGVVLTGMGDDGSSGVRAIKEHGGQVFAEGPETAVIYGMPGAAVRTGQVDRSFPLPALAEHLAALVG
jgi:two-component system chemotaxis response regulator CheB